MPVGKVPVVNSTAGEGSFSSKGFNGVYRARVDYNQDPLKIGRVKIRIPKVNGVDEVSGSSMNSLSWATPCFSSAGYNYGSYIVPEVGEYVFVAFEGGDSRKPVYLGSSYGTGSTNPKPYVSIDGSDEQSWQGEAGKVETPEEADGDPWYKIIYKTHEGHIIYMTDKKDKKELMIKDSEGQYLHFDNSTDKIKIEMKDSEGQYLLFDNGEEIKIELVDKDEQTIRMKDKKLEVIGKDELDINCGNVDINLKKDGKLTISTGGTTIDILNGNVTISADTANVQVPVANLVSDVATITSPLITMTGAVTVVGSLVTTA